MISKDAKNQLPLLHDIEEVSNRSVQFVGAALMLSLSIVSAPYKLDGFSKVVE